MLLRLTSSCLRMTLVKLTTEERESLLKPLFSAGWAMVDQRDAIHKVPAPCLTIGLFYSTTCPPSGVQVCRL